MREVRPSPGEPSARGSGNRGSIAPPARRPSRRPFDSSTFPPARRLFDLPLVVTVLVLALGLASPGRSAGPHYGGKYTQQRIANLRANVEKFDWAKAQRATAVNAASYWIGLSDDELWSMIPGQVVGRTIDVSMTNARTGVKEVRAHKCPACGDKINKYGNYPWIVDVPVKPWKIKCPSCGDIFPKNDFHKYYQSGIDDTGVFNPDKADKSLLYNEDHPNSNDPLHTYAVDDGYGWTDNDGVPYRFIGYYAWQHWRFVQSGLQALCNAYLYTGKPIYAHKAGVMFDRIADLYPAMDFAEYGRKRGWYHSCGGTGLGKIGGRIWEAGTVTLWGTCYDMVRSGLHNQPDLYTFLAQQAKRYKLTTKKGSYELLKSNIENNAVQEGVEAIFRGQVSTNEGGNQLAVLTCAIALNDDTRTEGWIDWVFAEGTHGRGDGGHIPELIVSKIDRDGVGAEGAPGYSLGWGLRLAAIANLLSQYQGYSKRDVYQEFPQVKQGIIAPWRLAILAANTPNIGDTGSCGSRGIVGLEPDLLVEGYQRLKDPQLALLAVRAKRGVYARLGRDILAKDPERVQRDIAALLRGQRAPPPILGENLSGYGLVSVEFGPADKGVGLWMYYGRSGGHGHRDRLNFGLDAYGFCMTPDLGYPEFATRWAKREQWTDNTISHNTVVINDLPQQANWGGHPEFFAHFSDFGGFSVSSPEVYGDLATIYNRTMALVKVGRQDAYALDIFRVQGGKDHLMSFHGLPGRVATGGLKLIKQQGGSYAGANVPWKKSPWAGPRCGYAWLNNVERDQAPPAAFQLDFTGEPGYRGLQAEDDLHLRYHCLTKFHNLALADGYPPANKRGAPEKLRYLLGRFTAGNEVPEKGLASTCVAILEPFRQTPLIHKVTRLPIAGQQAGVEAIAVKVELADGHTDYLLSAPDDGLICSTSDGMKFRGRLVAIRLRGGHLQQAWMARASHVATSDFSLTLPDTGHRGVVATMQKQLGSRGYIWVETQLPTDGRLRGAEIIIQNDRRRNAVYPIEAVEKDGNLYRIDCGEVSFVRQFKDPGDYAAGYVYNFEEGAPWIIPHRVSVARRGRHLVVSHTAAATDLTLAGSDP